jgi:ABC-type uncharacterized transport system YnjBCD ATPase subunit
MNQPASASLPGLFRAGDIGVSSEWRDITYDWAPLLTADGVFIYSYLRDMFDNQRILRPFLLDPDGPTKQRLQRVLGHKTGYALRGPEYLLETVGLLHIEVQYGVSLDAERPRHTAAAYYAIGRLDHPALDWFMLERVLDALMPALDPPADKESAARQKDAQAALGSLGLRGMFQNIDPEHLFDPDGAWPGLLPTLIMDERWTRLFSALHGTEAVLPYRRQTRAWVEWANRRGVSAMEANDANRDTLLGSQRRGQRGGHHTPPAGSIPVPAGASGVNNSGTDVPGGLGVTPRPPDPAVSPPCPRGPRMTQTPSGTRGQGSHGEAIQRDLRGVPAESLDRQLINISSSSGMICPELHAGTHEWGTPDGGTPAPTYDLSDPVRGEGLPHMATYLRDDELATTRLDARFWHAVHQIIHGDTQRYPHTDGEKKAARRLANKTGAPTGVLLAALRAVMMLPAPQRPHRFADALRLDLFHVCVQQALALLPARIEPVGARGDWTEFLNVYRAIGQAQGLRNVSASDYHALNALFAQQPDACWEVLNRVEHAAQLPELSPAYLRRAITNNQREAARQAMLPLEQGAACARVSNDAPTVPPRTPPVDPRVALLRQEGVPVGILTDEMTEDYIRAWIAEADAREDELDDRRKWLRWGIKSGKLPAAHKQLPPVKRRAPATHDRRLPVVPAADLLLPAPAQDVAASGDLLDTQWRAALDVLQARVSRDAYDTWLRCSRLLLIEGAEAVLSTPNVFVRDVIERDYRAAVEAALREVSGRPLALQVVIGT